MRKDLAEETPNLYNLLWAFGLEILIDSVITCNLKILCHTPDGGLVITSTHYPHSKKEYFS